MRPEQMVQHSFYACGSLRASAVCWQTQDSPQLSKPRPVTKGGTNARPWPFPPKPSSWMGTIALEFPAGWNCDRVVVLHLPSPFSFLSQVSELHAVQGLPLLFLSPLSLLFLRHYSLIESLCHSFVSNKRHRIIASSYNCVIIKWANIWKDILYLG